MKVNFVLISGLDSSLYVQFMSVELKASCVFVWGLRTVKNNKTCIHADNVYKLKMFYF